MRFKIVTTVADLLTLDRDDVRAGYRARESALSPFVSRAFFHGWRTGRIDHGLDAVDQGYRDLNSDLASYYAGQTTVGLWETENDRPSGDQSKPIAWKFGGRLADDASAHARSTPPPFGRRQTIVRRP